MRRFGVLRGMKEAQSCPGILVQGFWLQGFWALGLDPAWPGPGLAGAYFSHTHGVRLRTRGQSADEAGQSTCAAAGGKFLKPPAGVDNAIIPRVLLPPYRYNVLS